MSADDQHLRRPDLTAGYLVSALLKVLGHDGDLVTDVCITPKDITVDGHRTHPDTDEYGPRVGAAFTETHPIGWHP